MRFVVCHTCRRVVQIGGDPQEVQYLLGSQDSFPCVTALCGGRMQTIRAHQVATNTPEGYSISEMPIRSFFRAANGFGSGVGAPASLKRLKELLQSLKVVDLVAEATGQPERVILRQLILENGTRIHLETSAKGACVYYIEEPSPSCVEVVDGEARDGDPQRSDQDREEVRRAAQAQLEDRLREAGHPVGGHTARAAELSNSGSVPPLSEEGGVLPR